MSMQNLQYLYTKFEKMCTIQELLGAWSGVSKHWRLTPEMLSSVDNCLRNDDGLTVSKLKAKLLEKCTSFPDAALSTMTKSSKNHCTSVMLSYGS